MIERKPGLCPTGQQIALQICHQACARIENFIESDVVYVSDDIWQIMQCSYLYVIAGELKVIRSPELGIGMFHVTSHDEQAMIEEMERIVLL